MDALEDFEANRPGPTGLAYRLLGQLSEAEDVVQEAWLRWLETEPGIRARVTATFLTACQQRPPVVRRPW